MPASAGSLSRRGLAVKGPAFDDFVQLFLSDEVMTHEICKF